jgi:hypothetical protein
VTVHVKHNFPPIHSVTAKASKQPKVNSLNQTNHMEILLYTPEVADVGADVYSVVCAHPVALTGGSAGEGKLQVVTELGMQGKTDDDEGGGDGGGGGGDGGDGGAVANSSQIEEPVKYNK